jgi:hypothetical protein
VKADNFKPTYIPIDKYTIFSFQRFREQYGTYRKFVQNAPKTFRINGLVHPNLSIVERLNGMQYSCNLYIACSVPKLLWGHSYKEVKQTDFDAVIETYRNRLYTMGVNVSKDSIVGAHVQTLHYAKNIWFKDLGEARIFLERLSKTSIGSWHDNNVKSYTSDGKAVRFHTNVFEIVFYLKFADTLQKGSRSIDRSKTLQEIKVAKEYKNKNEIPPVVRMEIRFNGTRTISSHLKKAIGIEKDYWTFKEVFNDKICNQVLNYYWNKIINDRLNYFLLSKISDNDICMRILSYYKEEKLKDADEILGMMFRLRTLGAKAFKEECLTRHSRQTYQRKKGLLATFVDQFITADTSLIDTVTSALQGNPKHKEVEIKQLQMDI